MAMAFEYYLDRDYGFNTDFQKKLAKYLSQEYMEYINDQNLSVSESAVDIDINGDGDKDDAVDLTIEYNEEKYADTNGYGETGILSSTKKNLKNLETVSGKSGLCRCMGCGLTVMEMHSVMRVCHR